VIEPPRVKKISLEEAQQFRKEVLDPQFSEANEEMAVFISEGHVTHDDDHETSYQGINSLVSKTVLIPLQITTKCRLADSRELPLIHDEPLGRKKISRLNSASFHSNYSNGGTQC